MSYTLDEIKDAWQAYKSMQCLAILDGGKWRYELLTGRILRKIEGTKAEKRWVRDVYQFPTFLQEIWSGADNLSGRRASAGE